METSKNILNNLEKFNKEEDENIKIKSSIKHNDSDSEDDSLDNKKKRKEKGIL